MRSTPARSATVAIIIWTKPADGSTTDSGGVTSSLSMMSASPSNSARVASHHEGRFPPGAVLRQAEGPLRVPRAGEPGDGDDLALRGRATGRVAPARGERRDVRDPPLP